MEEYGRGNVAAGVRSGRRGLWDRERISAVAIGDSDFIASAATATVENIMFLIR